MSDLTTGFGFQNLYKRKLRDPYWEGLEKAI